VKPSPSRGVGGILLPVGPGDSLDALGPAGPLVSAVRLLPPLQPPAVRDFVTFEEHVEGVRRSVDGVAGVPERWYAAPTFYFTSPYAVYGPHVMTAYRYYWENKLAEFRTIPAGTPFTLETLAPDRLILAGFFSAPALC